MNKCFVALGGLGCDLLKKYEAANCIGNSKFIMPFKIDNSQLDDEYMNYLGRQEFYFADKPPLQEKIEIFSTQLIKY